MILTRESCVVVQFKMLVVFAAYFAVLEVHVSAVLMSVDVINNPVSM